MTTVGPYKLVAIDAGHGMANVVPGRYDPGAVAPPDVRAGHPIPANEAEIAWAWALTLKHVLTEAGVKARLLRDGIMTPDPLNGRVRKATDMQADCLISLHMNAFHRPAHGGLTIYRRSKPLATAVQECVDIAMGQNRTGYRSRGIVTEAQLGRRLSILGAPIDVVLVEPGFMSDPDDYSAIQRVRTRLAFSRALVSRIRK